MIVLLHDLLHALGLHLIHHGHHYASAIIGRRVFMAAPAAHQGILAGVAWRLRRKGYDVVTCDDLDVDRDSIRYARQSAHEVADADVVIVEAGEQDRHVAATVALAESFGVPVCEWKAEESDVSAA